MRIDQIAEYLRRKSEQLLRAAEILEEVTPEDGEIAGLMADLSKGSTKPRNARASKAAKAAWDRRRKRQTALEASETTEQEPLKALPAQK